MYFCRRDLRPSISVGGFPRPFISLEELQRPSSSGGKFFFCPKISIDEFGPTLVVESFLRTISVLVIFLPYNTFVRLCLCQIVSSDFGKKRHFSVFVIVIFSVSNIFLGFRKAMFNTFRHSSLSEYYQRLFILLFFIV